MADREARRGVIRSACHPWNGFTGKHVLTTTIGYQVRLDNDIECFVWPHEWEAFDD